MAKIGYWVGVAVFFAAMYLIVQWVVVSFMITSNGPVEWADGFEYVKCYWVQCG